MPRHKQTPKMKENENLPKTEIENLISFILFQLSDLAIDNSAIPSWSQSQQIPYKREKLFLQGRQSKLQKLRRSTLLGLTNTHLLRFTPKGLKLKSSFFILSRIQEVRPRIFGWNRPKPLVGFISDCSPSHTHRHSNCAFHFCFSLTLARAREW